MKLKDKIKALRKQLGLSQQDLASRTGSHITHISRLENGHVQPSLDLIKKLVAALEVSADYLLNDDTDTYDVHIEDKSLAEKIRLVDSLEEKDREALSHVIDSMLTKQRMKNVLHENMS